MEKEIGVKMKPYPETHQEGIISLENKQTIEHLFKGCNYLKGDCGVHIAKDGRIWVCLNGIAFMRFSPHKDGKMSKEE